MIDDYENIDEVLAAARDYAQWAIEALARPDAKDPELLWQIADQFDAARATVMEVRDHLRSQQKETTSA